MKKILFLIAFYFATVSSSWAACVGGTTIVGRNNVEYCISNFSMNWWAAHMWCQGNGMKLATPDELCNHDVYKWNGDNGCWNLRGKKEFSQHLWVNLASQNGQTLIIYNHLLYTTFVAITSSQLAACAPL